MPPTKNPLLSHFTERPASGSQKNPVLACNHCRWTGSNSHRAVKHLEDECTGYTQSERPAKRQATLQLGVQTLSKAKKEKLDSAAAMAVYIGARPFALFEELHMRRFINILSDELYTPLHRYVIGRDLLSAAYNEV
jgi:hypothetical protein